jgi:hypothetical protein
MYVRFSLFLSRKHVPVILNPATTPAGLSVRRMSFDLIVVADFYDVHFVNYTVHSNTVKYFRIFSKVNHSFISSYIPHGLNRLRFSHIFHVLSPFELYNDCFLGIDVLGLLSRLEQARS